MSTQTNKESWTVTEKEVSTGPREISASEVKSTQQTVAEKMLERSSVNVKYGDGDIPLPFVDVCSSIDVTLIVSSLDEG